MGIFDKLFGNRKKERPIKDLEEKDEILYGLAGGFLPDERSVKTEGIRNWLFQRKVSKRLRKMENFGLAHEIGSCDTCGLPCFKMGSYCGIMNMQALADYKFAEGNRCSACDSLVCGECAFKAGKQSGRHEQICPRCGNSLQ